MNDDFQLNIDDAEQKGPLTKLKDLIWRIPRKLRIVSTILLSAFIVITLLNAFKPEAQKREIPETVVRVDIEQVYPSSYPIVVNANGTIEAETRGNLVAQIRGEIVAVSDNFKTGGTFKKGDVLIQIDQRDYQAELSQSMASLSQAEANYRQEQANAKQAEQDWQRLGNNTAAPDLVLRKPQLAAAKAQRDSARAANQTAQLNLSRTTLRAPYDGRIIQRAAVLGQYVSIGTPIAEVFATEGVEVRLPISQEEFSQLGLDEFVNAEQSAKDFQVEISSANSSQAATWHATITRTDSTFDINTRQIDVIAEVSDPFSRSSNQPPLKIGQFVSARIKGRTIDNVFVIPNKSIREGSYIYAVRDERLTKQRINILWQDDQNALVSGESDALNVITSDIQPGELVVVTSLNSTLAGAKAKLSDEAMAAINSSTPNESLEIAELAQDTNAIESADQEAVDEGDSSVEDEQSDNVEITEDTPSSDEKMLDGESSASSSATSE